jgi:hypothetical protein
MHYWLKKPDINIIISNDAFLKPIELIKHHLKK